MNYTQWRPRFAEALSGDLYGIEYLDYLILGCGVATLHTGERSAIVTEFKYFPGPEGHGENIKVIHGLIAAGDMDEIKGLLIPRAEAWGKRQGCTKAMISSREGWGRVLKEDGYEPFQVTLVKPL